MVMKSCLAAAGLGLAATAAWMSQGQSMTIDAPAPQATFQDWRTEIAAAQAEVPGATNADCDFTVSMSRVHNVTRDADGRVIAAAIRGDAGPAAAPHAAPVS
ncbi:MAG: hypothetical protein GC206_14590 [Alphaproteobacteria bacterium]|nr:hypothetical protein [Alphaproteobacteria bacterium]